MRPFSLCLFITCFVFISSASPIQTNTRNITVRHEKRKRLRGDLIIDLPIHPHSQETSVRNSEKNVLVYNRTMQIFGEKVQKILNDSRKWRVKHSSNKSNLEVIDISKILKDRSDGSPERKRLSESKNVLSNNSMTFENDFKNINSSNRGTIDPNISRSVKISTTTETKSDNLNLDKTKSAAIFIKAVNENFKKGENRTFIEEHLPDTSFFPESDISSEITSLLSSSKKLGETSKIYSNFKNNGTKKDEMNRFDLNYDLEVLNLKDYELEANQLSNILRDLLDRLSNSDDVADHESTPPCQMWADCRWKLQEVLVNALPSCPCTYPSAIFYQDSIWDENKQKFYRWKDASGSSERLDVYKPVAKHCVRSIATDLYSIAAQHCCYDKEHRLLTRGSGAGSPNLVSPDISPHLHYRIDILPWHHCKGDFTRYNKVRPPNNGNKCSLNPQQQEYQRQIELATSF